MKLLPYNSENGFTLVEVLVALFIIALVIMGGGMFFFYGRVTIVREAHRRAAVLVASERLEELKAAEWEDIASEEFIPSWDPVEEAYGPYYIVWDEWASDWDLLETSSYDYVMVDNLADQTMFTQAWYCDDVGGDSYDYVKVKVTVNWVDSRTNSVTSTTLIAPR